MCPIQTVTHVSGRSLRRAGSQDSGLFFCTSYENSVVIFLISTQSRRGYKTRWSSRGFGLQLLPILLIHKGLWAASKIPFTVLGKKSNFSEGPLRS